MQERRGIQWAHQTDRETQMKAKKAKMISLFLFLMSMTFVNIEHTEVQSEPESEWTYEGLEGLIKLFRESDFTKRPDRIKYLSYAKKFVEEYDKNPQIHGVRGFAVSEQFIRDRLQFQLMILQSFQNEYGSRDANKDR